MALLDELSWRGLLQQQTHDTLSDELEKGPMTLYAGFDPSADSLHVGSLIPILGLAHFQRAGHRPIALVGGGTGLIGDPSFKASERSLLTREQVEQNVAGIKAQLEHILDFSGGNGVVMLNNIDWLGGLSFIDFLRDVGKHFSVNVMLSKDSVRQRLEDRDQGISFTEFTYSLLQAYDFLQLNETHDCRLQIGGSDQWGNIVAGIDLTRRVRGTETYGLTLPLVTKADGSKFGKSESGNIWLDPARTSPYKFYQFWLNQADADTAKYLKFFTFLDRDAIGELEAKIANAPQQREGQRRLAEEMTRLIHGDTALENAQKASAAMFGGDLSGLDEATLSDIFSEVPSSSLDKSLLLAGNSLVDLLVGAGVFPSKGDARRMVKNGGLYVNNVRVDDENAAADSGILLTESTTVLRKGKKNYHLLRFQ